jgi:hypothetical protein
MLFSSTLPARTMYFGVLYISTSQFPAFPIFPTYNFPTHPAFSFSRHIQCIKYRSRRLAFSVIAVASIASIHYPRITPNPPNITICSLETHSRIYACYDATWFPVYFLGLVIQLLFHCALPPAYPSRPSTSAAPWPRSQFVLRICSATTHLHLISVGHRGHACTY